MGNFYFNSPDKSDLKLFKDNSDGNLFFDYLYGFRGTISNPIFNFSVSNYSTLVPFNPGYLRFTFATSVPETNPSNCTETIEVSKVDTCFDARYICSL